MRRIVLAFVRSVGRSVSCWKLCHSEHVLGAKTDAANSLSPRASLFLFLSPSPPPSLARPFLFSRPAATVSLAPTFLQRAIVFRHGGTLYIP